MDRMALRFSWALGFEGPAVLIPSWLAACARARPLPFPALRPRPTFLLPWTLGPAGQVQTSIGEQCSTAPNVTTAARVSHTAVLGPNFEEVRKGGLHSALLSPLIPFYWLKQATVLRARSCALRVVTSCSSSSSESAAGRSDPVARRRARDKLILGAPVSLFAFAEDQISRPRLRLPRHVMVQTR